MSYVRTTWQNGDTITAAKLNNIETGILGNESGISDLNTNLSGDIDDLQGTVASTYDSTSTYAVGDYVYYNDVLYRCTTAITTAESWTAGHWTACNLAGEVGDLKEDFSSIATQTSNLLDTSKLTANYIPADGSVNTSVDFHATDYIRVEPGQSIYGWGKTNGTYTSITFRFVCAYDSTKTAISAKGANNEMTPPFIVPDGISYLRITIRNAVVSYDDLYIGTHSVGTNYEPYGYVIANQEQVDVNTANIATNTANIATNTADIAQISEMSSNLCDRTKLVAEYIPADGSVNTSVDFHATDYLPVTAGETIYGWGKNGGAYEAFTYRFICAYDSSKTAVPASGSNSETSGVYTVPEGIAYLRITIRNAVVLWDEIYIGTHLVGVDYQDYGLMPKIPPSSDATHTVSSGGSILEGVKYCYANNIKNLIVEAGTYDIISEYESHYGATYFDDYIDYAQGDIFDAGIWLQNITVKFSSGAKVTCKYTGNNTNVNDYFSAFATGNNVIIEGLVLDAENLRYGIHADYNSGSDETYFILRRCDLKNVRSDGNKDVGAGLGIHVNWLFEDCIFRTTGNYYAMRIHNNVSSAAQSKIIVRNCYIDGDGYFMFSAYSTSTAQTIIQVCGNSYKTAPVVNKETEQSNENFTMIAWNNELRT